MWFQDVNGPPISRFSEGLNLKELVAYTLFLDLINN